MMYIKKINDFSSNLIIFDQTETRFGHFQGKLVKYNNKTLIIGGDNATVEELNAKQKSWVEHAMSPVNGSTALYDATALSIDSVRTASVRKC